MQEAVPCLTDEGVNTQDIHPLCETWTVGICFPILHQVPIDVTAWWAASPVDTRPPGPHLYSWVDWNKFLAQGNNNKVALMGTEPEIF